MTSGYWASIPAKYIRLSKLNRNKKWEQALRLRRRRAQLESTHPMDTIGTDHPDDRSEGRVELMKLTDGKTIRLVERITPESFDRGTA